MAKKKGLTDEALVVALGTAGVVPVVDLGNFRSNLAEHYPDGWGGDEVAARIQHWKDYGWVTGLPI